MHRLTPNRSELTDLLHQARTSGIFPKSGMYSLDNPMTFFALYAYPMAKTVEELYHVPVAVTLAQSGTESKDKKTNIPGTSLLTVNANNWFGIKADPSWHGQVYKIGTREQTKSGKDYFDPNAVFRAYPSNEDSWNDYGFFLSSQPRYKKAFTTRDPKLFMAHIHSGKYATDKNYNKVVQSVITSMIRRVSLVSRFYAQAFASQGQTLKQAV